VTGHRCQHLFPDGWEPPDDEPCGAAGAVAVIVVVAAIVALAAIIALFGWVFISAAWAGGLAMVVTARPPVHRCAYCGDEIRTTCGIVIRQGQIWCCDPCYYTAHPEAAR
jgi:cobalamin synthase